MKDGQLIGDIGVRFLDDSQVELGYTLSPEYQGKGYAAEAVNAVIDYLFTVLKSIGYRLRLTLITLSL